MKIKNIVTVLLISLILASCAPASTPTLASTATNAPSPTEKETITPEPTATFTPEPTATPVIFIEGLNNIPQPNDDFINRVVSENYLKVMGLSREQVNLVYVEHNGIDGQTFIVMLDNTTGVPLAVYTDEWQKATLKFFGRQVGIVMGTDTAENPNLAEIEVSREFERATIQVGNEWFRVEPEQGKIDPLQAKATESVIRILKNEAGITDIVGHPIIAIYPDWLINGNFTQDELRDIMRKRIEYAIRSNPDIRSWVVVNEPYDLNNPDRQQDPFYKAWGGFSYIQEAFSTARKTADEMGRADIKLIFNDTDNHRANGGTTQATREIVRMLIQENLIDYVGMQMHFNQWGGVTNGKVDTITIANEIAYYKNLGIPVLITELTYEPTEAELKMSDREFNERLSTIFEQVFRVAIESGNVQQITFWGLTDKWLEDINWYMIFDKHAQPKQSYYIVLKALYEGIK